jgi:hypothetical protein
MTDWTRVRTALEADATLDARSRAQVWRWSEGFRRWLDERDIEGAIAGRPEMVRFLDAGDWGPGSSNRHQRMWALRKLVALAQSLPPARARSTAFATARLDDVPERSPLGIAITRVLAGAKTASDRARFRTALGTFLRWCDGRGREPRDCWPGDVDAFRRDYVASGRTSPGEYVRVARRLLAALEGAAQGSRGPVDG